MLNNLEVIGHKLEKETKTLSIKLKEFNDDNTVD